MPATVPPAHVVVDDEGITLDRGADRAIDVLFDDRRVFSFWSLRDTREVPGGARFAWPRPLRRFLDGTVTVSLVDHVAGAELFRETVRLGSGTGAVVVADKQGNPLGLDKSWRLMRLFESRDAEQSAPTARRHAHRARGPGRGRCAAVPGLRHAAGRRA
ncbi:MAG: hypothetical protein R2731_11465 [Nocardioides sp.]